MEVALNPTTFSLVGSHILVSGAAGGVGSAVVSTLLAAGAHVIGVERHTPPPREGVSWRSCDLTDEKAVSDLLEEVTTTFPLDGVIHLVGGYTDGQRVDQASWSSWETMLNLNLKASVLLVGQSVAHFRKQGRGSIAVVGSALTLPGTRPTWGVGPYVVSKAAVASLVEVAAAELVGSGVRINLVTPVTIATPANLRTMPDQDSSRWVTPEEVAHSLAWLVSDGAAGIHGQILRLGSRS